MHSVLGAGLLALDVVLSDGESASASTYAGGTCGNVLAILSYLGWSATPVGVVGDDNAGRRLLADLQGWNIKLDYLVANGHYKTPVFIQTLCRDKLGLPKHTFSDACPSCGSSFGTTLPLELPDVDFSADFGSDFFFMDRLSSPILELAEVAKACGAMIVYEPSSQGDKEFWTNAMELVDLLKYSADRFSSDEFASWSRSLRWEVQTEGAQGLRYRSRNFAEESDWQRLDAVPAPRLVDTCGAGDWTTAGLLFALAENPSGLEGIEEFSAALRIGQTYAAWACSFEGARGAMYANASQETQRAVDMLSRGLIDFELLSVPSKLDTDWLEVCDALHGRLSR